MSKGEDDWVQPAERGTPSQKAFLLEFLEQRPLLAQKEYGSAAGRKEAEAEWSGLARSLNQLLGGAQKTVVQWIKYWDDQRTAVKKRAARISPIARGIAPGHSIRRSVGTPSPRPVHNNRWGRVYQEVENIPPRPVHNNRWGRVYHVGNTPPQPLSCSNINVPELCIFMLYVGLRAVRTSQTTASVSGHQISASASTPMPQKSTPTDEEWEAVPDHLLTPMPQQSAANDEDWETVPDHLLTPMPQQSAANDEEWETVPDHLLTPMPQQTAATVELKRRPLVDVPSNVKRFIPMNKSLGNNVTKKTVTPTPQPSTANCEVLETVPDHLLTSTASAPQLERRPLVNVPSNLKTIFPTNNSLGYNITKKPVGAETGAHSKISYLVIPRKEASAPARPLNGVNSAFTSSTTSKQASAPAVPVSVVAGLNSATSSTCTVWASAPVIPVSVVKGLNSATASTSAVLASAPAVPVSVVKGLNSATASTSAVLASAPAVPVSVVKGLNSATASTSTVLASAHAVPVSVVKGLNSASASTSTVLESAPAVPVSVVKGLNSATSSTSTVRASASAIPGSVVTGLNSAASSTSTDRAQASAIALAPKSAKTVSRSGRRLAPRLRYSP
ncbi:Signaling mucin HKR1 [Frankliniella fusca]|uniref:Regulatory protein zeste n=1 Tax=Frankliniella fusca TaxID=407009 RepID=A0AAE1HV62_9NEOP|nr:Signaling mucin HKR1 [Frankliniella fusca]